MPLLYSTMEQHNKVALHSTTSGKKSLISSSSKEWNVASIEELLLQQLLFSSPSSSSLNLFFYHKILFGLEKALCLIAGLFDNENPYIHVISPICPFFYLLIRISAFLRVIANLQGRSNDLLTMAWTKQSLHHTDHSTLNSSLLSLLHSMKERKWFQYLCALQLFRYPSWKTSYYFEYKGESGLQVLERKDEVG